MENKHWQSFDQKIKEKLEAGENQNLRPVPDRLWANISETLIEDEQSGETEKVLPVGRSRSFGWAAAAAMLCLTVGLAWWLSRPIEILYLSQQHPLTEDQRAGDPNSEMVGGLMQPETTARVISETEQGIHVAPKSEQTGLNMQEAQDTQEITRRALPENTRAVLAGVQPQAIHGELSVVNPMQTMFAGRSTESPIFAPDKPLQTAENFGVSNVLNFVIARVDKREEKFIQFSTDDEGFLKVAFNFTDFNRN